MTQENYVRGHLLHEDLGGSGKKLENLVPLSRSANARFYHGFEQQVIAAKANQTLFIAITPRFAGGSSIPYEVDAYAVGSGGFFRELQLKA